MRERAGRATRRRCRSSSSACRARAPPWSSRSWRAIRTFGAGELSDFDGRGWRRLGGVPERRRRPTDRRRRAARARGRAISRGLAALRAGAPRGSPTRCRPISVSPGSSIWRCRTRASSMLRRDPVDTCLSCFSKLFAGDQPFTYDLGELGRYYRAYESADGALARRYCRRASCSRCEYEELVADLEREARAHPRVIAASTGTMPASPSTRPSGRCAPPARPRCASRSTAARSGAGGHRRKCCGRCSTRSPKADASAQGLDQPSRRRRQRRASPVSHAPNSASELGSGTAEGNSSASVTIRLPIWRKAGWNNDGGTVRMELETNI